VTAQSIIDRICKIEETVEELKSDASSDWKTSYLKSVEIIKAISAEKERLQTALDTIADICIVPIGTHEEMCNSWRKATKSRIDIARATLGTVKKDYIK
jgi:hypothetical protein